MSHRIDRWIRLWFDLSPRRKESEIDEELEFHLGLRTREYQDQGLTFEEARRKAEALFGGIESVRSTLLRRERWKVLKTRWHGLTSNLRIDLRSAARHMRRRPAFTAVTLTMVAMGSGATTAVFGVAYSLLLHPLPFEEASRIVQIWESRIERGWERMPVAPGNFWDIRGRVAAFEDLGAFRSFSTVLTGRGRPERLTGGQITAGFFDTVLGVQPVLGRTLFAFEDDPRASRPVVILGSDFWHRAFAGDSSILGTTLTLDGVPHVVVGVLPPGRSWLAASDVYIPMVPTPTDPRDSFELAVVGRLREGVSVENGLLDLETVARQMEQNLPQELAGIGLAMTPASDWRADGPTRRALLLLLGAVGALLAIASVNLCCLFLARAMGRHREAAIHFATGAGRGRIIQQTITESILICLIGAVAGYGLAVWSIDAFEALAPGEVAVLHQAKMSYWVRAFALVTGLATGVVTGLVPALHLSGPDTTLTLRSGAPSGHGTRRNRRLRDVLLASEVAVSLVLLVGAGLLSRSLLRLVSTDPGFDAEGRLMVSVSLPPDFDPADTGDFLEGFIHEASSLPMVEAAAAVSVPPYGGRDTNLGIASPDRPHRAGPVPRVPWRMVTPGYFDALGVPLVRGRDFDARDLIRAEEDATPIIVSRSLAALLWPGENPLERIAILWAGQRDRPGRVIGVVGDIRERELALDRPTAVYLPYSKPWPPALVVRTRAEPETVVDALRSVAVSLDADVALSGAGTMEEAVGRSVAPRRLIVLVLGSISVLALFLALGGIYGVQAYTVAQRTPEIGVRMAVGAMSRQVMDQLVAETTRPVLVGIGVGVLCAAGISTLLSGMLFQVAPWDPSTYLGISLAVLTASFLACWIPARRALGVDPVNALRSP